jgi:hypothetical protein
VGSTWTNLVGVADGTEVLVDVGSNTSTSSRVGVFVGVGVTFAVSEEKQLVM